MTTLATVRRSGTAHTTHALSEVWKCNTANVIYVLDCQETSNTYPWVLLSRNTGQPERPVTGIKPKTSHQSHLL